MKTTILAAAPTRDDILDFVHRYFYDTSLTLTKKGAILKAGKPLEGYCVKKSDGGAWYVEKIT